MRYLHLDVFTDRPFEGNQLAVFPEPGDATAEQMQNITREMNFLECTFIFPPERGGDVRMRIFTPGSELPMAGQPTFALAYAVELEWGGRGGGQPEGGVGPLEGGVGPPEGGHYREEADATRDHSCRLRG
jgi:trans-2,3-dihydro-3-hydroxyanthranilate isomerase